MSRVVAHLPVSPCPPTDSEPPAWHAAFLRLLPAIWTHARIRFRWLRSEAREEAVQEAICNALAAYVRLVETGRSEVASASCLARFAVAQVREGRKVGGRLNVRDVMASYCQRRKGLILERLDQWDKDEECWREILVEDKTSTPAEIAGIRIDFAAWLANLPPRNRKIAETLATGESTGQVALRFKLSPARVSQLRGELRSSWEVFQGSGQTTEF